MELDRAFRAMCRSIDGQRLPARVACGRHLTLLGLLLVSSNLSRCIYLRSSPNQRYYVFVFSSFFYRSLEHMPICHPRSLADRMLLHYMMVSLSKHVLLRA
uniref:Uncharacterized protein n=1 Tax=Oryza brachyantha TaxID=4533 RepID=J3LIE6_ORYBR